MMKGLFFWLQQRQQPKAIGRRDSLHQPSQDGRESGDYPYFVARSSAYTAASFYPVATAACLVMGTALAVAEGASDFRIEVALRQVAGRLFVLEVIEPADATQLRTTKF